MDELGKDIVASATVLNTHLETAYPEISASIERIVKLLSVNHFRDAQLLYAMESLYGACQRTEMSTSLSTKPSSPSRVGKSSVISR